MAEEEVYMLYNHTQKFAKQFVWCEYTDFMKSMNNISI